MNNIQFTLFNNLTNCRSHFLLIIAFDFNFQSTEMRKSPSSPGNKAIGPGNDAIVGNDGDEQYEKGIPIHGDVMFHNFLVTLQENPGQILR